MPKEKTVTFKLYQYVNGLGETVFRAKQEILPGWFWWVRPDYPFDNQIRSWKTRDGVISFLKTEVYKERNELAAAKKSKAAETLKLVVIEEVKL